MEDMDKAIINPTARVMRVTPDQMIAEEELKAALTSTSDLANLKINETSPITVQITCSKEVATFWDLVFTKPEDRGLPWARVYRWKDEQFMYIPDKYIDPIYTSNGACSPGMDHYAPGSITGYIEKCPETVRLRYRILYSTCLQATKAYYDLISAGCDKDEASAVLPKNTAGVLYISTDLATWYSTLARYGGPRSPHHSSEVIRSWYTVVNCLSEYFECFETLKGTC